MSFSSTSMSKLGIVKIHLGVLSQRSYLTNVHSNQRPADHPLTTIARPDEGGLEGERAAREKDVSPSYSPTEEAAIGEKGKKPVRRTISALSPDSCRRKIYQSFFCESRPSSQAERSASCMTEHPRVIRPRKWTPAQGTDNSSFHGQPVVWGRVLHDEWPLLYNSDTMWAGGDLALRPHMMEPRNEWSAPVKTPLSCSLVKHHEGLGFVVGIVFQLSVWWQMPSFPTQVLCVCESVCGGWVGMYIIIIIIIWMS